MDSFDRVTLLRCLVVNVGLVIIIAIAVFALRDDNSTYFRIGPHDDLMIVSVTIDTNEKYAGFLVFIAIIIITRVVVKEMAMPILGFSVYNPDKKTIVGVGKLELQFYANAMFMIDALQGVFMVLINITQIDLALFKVVISELATVFTIRTLLNKKEFINKSSKETQPINEPDSEDSLP